MKKLLTLLLALTMCVCLVNINHTKISAEDENTDVITETLDFINHPNKAIYTLNKYKTKGSKDSTWDSVNKVLTLKGVDFISTAKDVILLPGDSTIYVDGLNCIRGDNTIDNDATIITAKGSLLVSRRNDTGAYLSIKSNINETHILAFNVDGDLTIEKDFVEIISTRGLVYCNGDFTLNNVSFKSINYDTNVPAIEAKGKFINTCEFDHLEISQYFRSYSSDIKPVVVAEDYVPFVDEKLVDTNLSGTPIEKGGKGKIVFDKDLKTFVYEASKIKCGVIKLYQTIKYTINFKLDNGVQFYKGDTLITDQSKWPYCFYRKDNSNVLYLNEESTIFSMAPIGLHIGEGIEISGGRTNNDSKYGKLYINVSLNDGTDKYSVLVDKDLKMSGKALISCNLRDSDNNKKTAVGLKAESIKLDNSAIDVGCNIFNEAKGMVTKSIEMNNESRITSSAYSQNDDEAIAILLDNIISNAPIKMNDNSTIMLSAVSTKGETLVIKSNNEIKEINNSFGIREEYIAETQTYEYYDTPWRQLDTKDGYHYTNTDSSVNPGTHTTMVFLKPEPKQTYKNDMSYSNNKFVGDVVKGNEKELAAYLLARTYDFLDMDSVSVVNKTTGKTLELNKDYYLDEDNPIRFVFTKDYLKSLKLGTYELEISFTYPNKEYKFNVKLNDHNPSPDPQPKDESCEKVIGPTWHWNNAKGVCEEVSVVGTSTR